MTQAEAFGYPKSEYRNPKQIRNSKRSSVIRISDFAFVSDFDIRISDFGRVVAAPRGRLLHDACLVIPSLDGPRKRAGWSSRGRRICGSEDQLSPRRLVRASVA
jgi:hypothetical protein